MAKIQIKSEKLTPFGGIFSIMEKFDSMLSPVIDSTLGQRCSSIFGYQFSEIVRSLMSVYFCGGSCVEDVTSQLMRHLSYHPTLRTCSSDTILRAIKELTQENISYTSDQGKTYDFNTADKLNTLLINALVSTGELKEMAVCKYCSFNLNGSDDVRLAFLYSLCDVGHIALHLLVVLGTIGCIRIVRILKAVCLYLLLVSKYSLSVHYDILFSVCLIAA